MLIIELLKALVFGIVEGITEWLPVSSTGHLILLDEFLGLNVAPGLGETFKAEFLEMFNVVIQLGAILAVIVMFFRKLNPFAPSKTAAEKKSTWISSAPGRFARSIPNAIGRSKRGSNFLTIAR